VNPDLVNGIYEAAGAAFILRNCLLTFRAKTVEGVSILTTAFFTSWGLWNLYYYPALHQWLSFVGGACIALANLLWIGLMVHYKVGWDALAWLLVGKASRAWRALNHAAIIAIDWSYAKAWWAARK
jgi:hypothetical protein